MKKFLAFILSVLTLFAFIPAFTVGTSAYTVGDLNNDGKHNAQDSILLTAILIGEHSAPLAHQMGDINHDEKVNTIDQSLLNMFIVGSYMISSEKYNVEEVTLGGTDVCEYVILLPQEVPDGALYENARYGAELIRQYVEEACGIKLDIVTEPKAHNIEFVFDASLGSDAFTITVSEGKVTLNCGILRGGMYSAVGFLKDFFGYTFYPRDVVKLSAEGKVEKEVGYVHSEGFNTSFETRDAYTNSKIRGIYDDAHSAAYKMSTLAHHNTGMWDGNGWINSSKYGFVRGANRNHSMSMFIEPLNSSGIYCLSDPANIETCIENVSSLIDSFLAQGFKLGTTMPMISIAMEDTSLWCSCRLCRIMIRDHGKASSATIVNFINKVSEAVTPNYPGIEFWTLAYLTIIKAPTDMEVCDNLYICFAPINHCMNHVFDDENCKTNSLNYNLGNDWGKMEYIEGWKALTDNVHLWWYGTPYEHMIQYVPQLNWLYRNLSYMKRYELKGSFYENEETTLSFTDLTTYLVSEFTWNPDITEEEFFEIVRKFCVDYYGSEDVYSLLMLMESATDNSCWNCLSYSGQTMQGINYSYLQEKYETLYSLIESVLADVADDRETYDRTRRALISIEFDVLSASHETEYVSGSAEQREKYVERYQTFYNYLNENRGKFYITFFPNHTAKSVPTTLDVSVPPIMWY